MNVNQVIYVKFGIGVLHTTGKMGKIVKVNKKDGEIYSIRVDVHCGISIDRGFEKLNFKHTYKLATPAYQFFTIKEDFIKSMEAWYENAQILIGRTRIELDNF